MKVAKKIIICSILILVLTACGIVGFYARENSINIGDWLHGQQNVTNQQYVDLKQEYENRIQEFYKEISNLETENENLIKQLKNEQDNVSDLTAQVAALQKEKDDNELKIKDYETQISQLNSRISSLQDVVNDNTQEIANLEHQKFELSERVSELEQAAEINSDEIARLQEQQQALTAQIAQLESDVQSKEIEIVNLEEAKQGLESQIAALERENDENETLLIELLFEIDEKDSKISELEQSLSEKNSEIESLNSTITELQKQLETQPGVAFEFSKTFGENSPETISIVSKLISACDMTSSQVADTFGWKIGDAIDVPVGKETATMLIAGFNHDDLSGEHEKAGISLIMKNLLTDTYCMNSTCTSVDGWDASLMRNDTMVTLFSQLPANWQNVIKSVDKKASAGQYSADIITSSDKLWLLSLAEIFSADAIKNSRNSRVKEYSDVFVSEGTQYDYFNGLIANGDPYKKYDALVKRLSNGSGGAEDWWLRSPSPCGSVGGVLNGVFEYVSQYGYADSYQDAHFTSAISFGFCI